MLNDFLTSRLTTCSPYVRGLGYLDESLDMRRRARRNASAWRPHLDHSRRFILACAEKCRGRDKVTVLGSGLLLDVPLAELSGLFREVVLMDVVCLPEIRKQIGRFDNAKFVEYDVTGVAERMQRTGASGLSGLPEPVQQLSDAAGNADLVVSLNILSQLWVVPRTYASRKMRRLDEYAVDEWCGRVVAAHCAALRLLSGDVCLIADHEYVKRDSTGEIVSRGSTVYGLELPKADEQWFWNIVPPDGKTGTVSKDLIVGAWHWGRITDGPPSRPT